jgi:hypothetical protein
MSLSSLEEADDDLSGDRGFTISPEITYTGFTNWDLCLKASFINGPKESEFGEKPYGFKLELRVGNYF